jgi:uncharacterized protein (TIGR03083 family)
MDQVRTLTPLSTPAVPHGATVAALSHREATAMAAEELRRFLTLLDSLELADWDQPTACTLWTVKDIASHQAAHVSGTTSIGAFIGQQNPRLLRPYRQRGLSMLDAWNQSQVDLRRALPGEAIAAEIRDGGARSLRMRDRLPAFIRGPRLPLPDMDQSRSLGYLFDVIYTRDMWMHRYDICLATGRNMALDSGHDSRIVALIVRDLAEKSRKALGGRSALLRLTGPAGGTWALGSDQPDTALVEMDVLLFCSLTSGRITADEALASADITLSGDRGFARELVQFCDNRVLY